MTTDNILTFLQARISETDATMRGARDANPGPWKPVLDNYVDDRVADWTEAEIFDGNEERVVAYNGSEAAIKLRTLKFIGEHHPIRVIREIHAKRDLIVHALDTASALDNEAGCGHTALQIRNGECPKTNVNDLRILRILAMVDGDHVDYDENWSTY